LEGRDGSEEEEGLSVLRLLSGAEDGVEEEGEEEEEEVKRVAGAARRYVSAARRNAQPSAEGGGEEGVDALEAAEELGPERSKARGRRVDEEGLR